MKKLGTFVVSADRYQFQFADAASPWVEEDEAVVVPRVFYQRGFGARQGGIWIGGRAHLNIYRVDVFAGEKATDDTDAERVFAANLRFPSGRLILQDIYRNVYGEVQLVAGTYAVYVRAFNLGQDVPNPFKAPQGAPLPGVRAAREASAAMHARAMKRKDTERYEIILVPGRARRTGVIRGPRSARPLLSGRRERIVSATVGVRHAPPGV